MKLISCQIILCFASFVYCDYFKHFENQLSDNELSCPYDRSCVSIDCCPGVETLMNKKSLPVHRYDHFPPCLSPVNVISYLDHRRFRLAVCGYDGTAVKVCCSPSPNGYPPQTGLRGTYDRSGMKTECGSSFVPLNISPMTLGSFPFLARIGFVNVITRELKYPCIGTIINARTILTTATCALAQSNDYKLQSVLVGEYDTATDPDCNSMFCGHKPTSLKISYIVKHPSFNPDTFANNIALIRLEESMNFTVTVQPACLYTGLDFNLMTTDDVRLYGWGKLPSETNSSTILRSLYMRILSRQDCVDFANRGLCVELCAIGEQEPCSGFSGSPLIRMNRNKYTIIGILSYGSTCEDNRNNPVAFVDVQRYADWINQN